jgi:HEAT repeat protein
VPELPDDAWFARLLGAERMILGREELDDLLHTLATGSEEVREQAALALGGFGSAAIEDLAAMLVEGDADARWWAARALAEVGGDGAVAPLVLILDDVNPDVRACAVLALGRIGDGAAAPALLARLADESAFVAGLAADALSMIGVPAIESLARTLTAESAHVRLLAVRALGRIGSQSAIGPLFGMLEDPSYLVRYYAREALESSEMGMVFVMP